MARQDPGTFDRLVNIRQPVKTKGASGAEVLRFDQAASILYQSVAARKEPARTVEGVVNDQIVATSFDTWVTYWLDGVDSTMVLEDQTTGLYYQIIGEPIEIGRRMGLSITTRLFDNNAVS